MLQDAFGRQFSYLRLSITDLCNYRCNYCLPDGMPCADYSSLSLDHIGHIAAAFAAMGIEKIRITGGEPSVRKDLPQIIRLLKETPGIKSVVMTTNGHKMSKYLDSWADAGLDALNISCDSLDPRVFDAITGRDELDKLLEAIKLAQISAIKTIKINTVLLKQYNLTDLHKLIDWVKDSDLTLRFIELMETGDNADYFASNHVSAETVQKLLMQTGWQQTIRDKAAGPAKEFKHADYQGKIGFIAPYSKDFCDSCNRLRVSSSGKLHLCLFGDSGYDLTPMLVPGKEIELQNYLSEVLQTKPISHFLQEHNTGSTAQLAMLGG